VGVIRRAGPAAARSSSFAEISARFAVASPILRDYSRPYIAMKRRIRPIVHTRDEAVFERVDVAIFDMARVVSLVADRMLPEPTLPDAALVAGDANGAEPLVLRQRSRKAALDQPPACGEIAVAGRQLPDACR
jgi:hypothetical protein